MSDVEYNPSHITPEQFMVLVEIEEKSELIEYIDEDVIDYNKKNDEVYFTEQNVIDYLCPDDFWDEEDKPNSIDEMNRYKTIESEWPDIVEQAEEIDIDLSFLDENDSEEQNLFEKSDVCLVCGDKKIRSKSLCNKHYNRVYYHYDEVTEQSINAYKENKTGDSSWSRDYGQCQRCYTTDREHHAQGYCKKCYYKEYHGSNKKTTA